MSSGWSAPSGLSPVEVELSGERSTAVRAERAPELGVVVGDTVGVSGSAGAEIGARVVLHDRQVSGGLIERDLEELLFLRRSTTIDSVCLSCRPANTY